VAIPLFVPLFCFLLFLFFACLPPVLLFYFLLLFFCLAISSPERKAAPLEPKDPSFPFLSRNWTSPYITTAPPANPSRAPCVPTCFFINGLDAVSFPPPNRESLLRMNGIPLLPMPAVPSVRSYLLPGIHRLRLTFYRLTPSSIVHLFYFLVLQVPPPPPSHLPVNLRGPL